MELEVAYVRARTSLMRSRQARLDRIEERLEDLLAEPQGGEQHGEMNGGMNGHGSAPAVSLRPVKP
eukprot:231294-Hanusia_phi.AAC.1